MSATISATNGAGSSVATTTLSPYEFAYTGRNVILDLLDGGIAVALVTPRPSSGTLEFLYPDEDSARAAAVLHREESTFVLADDDRPAVGLEYVVDGDVRLRLDEDTLTQWVLSVDYQEVDSGSLRVGR